MEAEDKAFLLKLRDVTMAAIEEGRFAQVVGKLKESAGIPITGKVTEVVELTGKTYGFNTDEQDSILQYLIAGGDHSQYVLSLAITTASQDVDSNDSATALERIGWQVPAQQAPQ